jgi:hypothetical protein
MKEPGERHTSPPAEIADRMADAVAYLSRVADDAGMKGISAELRAIRRRLTRTATSGRAGHQGGGRVG